jgi:hypothetical protein
MSSQAFRCGLLDCSVKTLRQASDISSLSSTRSGQIGDKLETKLSSLSRSSCYAEIGPNFGPYAVDHTSRASAVAFPGMRYYRRHRFPMGNSNFWTRHNRTFDVIFVSTYKCIICCMPFYKLVYKIRLKEEQLLSCINWIGTILYSLLFNGLTGILNE